MSVVPPVEVLLRAAVDRSAPAAYMLTSANVFDLLTEAVNLAKILATQERDLEVIRSEYQLRATRIASTHDENIMMLASEYAERAEQINIFNRTVQLLVSAGQFQIAQQLMNRLADILAISPLDKVLKNR